MTRNDPVVPRRGGVVAALVVAVVLLVGAALCQVWTKLRVLDYGYKIAKANRQQTKLLEINRKLRVELTMLKNPNRIKRIASERIGMVLPAPTQVKRIRPRPPQKITRLQKRDTGKRNGS